MKTTPPGFYKWNRALQGAFRKGYTAHHDGLKQTDCPYQDHRQDSGHLTWSRSFITAWEDGWNWAQLGN